MYPESILPIAAHIPHAGTIIPNAVQNQFTVAPQSLWREITRVTDWYTDELFSIPGVATTKSPFSRLVVDLERYIDDELEEKAACGQGVIYTHNTLGEQIRRPLSELERSHLLDNYYYPWHLQLELNLAQQLDHWGHCLLLDCHSFPDIPFANEDDQGRPRPDICLGFNAHNTPQWLVSICRDLFQQRGYSVEIDFPYTGCLVPDKYLGDVRVPAMMLEINRRLYLNPATQEELRPGDIPVRSERFEALQNDIWSVILILASQMVCRSALSKTNA